MTKDHDGEPTLGAVSPELVVRLGTAFMATRHLIAASDVGIFPALADGPLALDELAGRLGIPRGTPRISADAMVALGLMAGTVGGGGRVEFTVIGDVVNTAATIEAATRETADVILVSDATRERLATGVKARLVARPGVPLGGKSHRGSVDRSWESQAAAGVSSRTTLCPRRSSCATNRFACRSGSRRAR